MPFNLVKTESNTDLSCTNRTPPWMRGEYTWINVPLSLIFRNIPINAGFQQRNVISLNSKHDNTLENG